MHFSLFTYIFQNYFYFICSQNPFLSFWHYFQTPSPLIPCFHPTPGLFAFCIVMHIYMSIVHIQVCNAYTGLWCIYMCLQCIHIPAHAYTHILMLLTVSHLCTKHSLIHPIHLSTATPELAALYSSTTLKITIQKCERPVRGSGLCKSLVRELG